MAAGGVALGPKQGPAIGREEGIDDGHGGEAVEQTLLDRNVRQFPEALPAPITGPQIGKKAYAGIPNPLQRLTEMVRFLGHEDHILAGEVEDGVAIVRLADARSPVRQRREGKTLEVRQVNVV